MMNAHEFFRRAAEYRSNLVRQEIGTAKDPANMIVNFRGPFLQDTRMPVPNTATFIPLYEQVKHHHIQN